MAVGELERLFGGSGSRPKNWTLSPVELLGLLLLLVVLLLSRKNTPAPMESLHALPHDRHDGSLSWAECWVVAELSHPAFCSARELTARAALWGGHALDVVEGLTVRMQRVRVDMLESVSFCRHFRGCFFFCQFAGCGGGRVWRTPSYQYHRCSGEVCFAPSS